MAENQAPVLYSKLEKVLQGLSAELAGRGEAAAEAFEMAYAATDSAAQQAFFDSLRLRQELLATPSNELLATEIGQQFEAFRGTEAP